MQPTLLLCRVVVVMAEVEATGIAANETITSIPVEEVIFLDLLELMETVH